MPDPEPRPEQRVSGTPTEIAIRWMFGQPFNNVMLIAIYLSLAWGARYCAMEAVPAHLQMIQKGYESLEKSHQDERNEMRSMYDKWFDRVANGPSHATAMPESPESTSANN
jgi:hypothetical protein